MAKVQFLLRCLSVIVLLTPLTPVRPGVYQPPAKPRVSCSSGYLKWKPLPGPFTPTSAGGAEPSPAAGRGLPLQGARPLPAGVNNKVNNLHKMEVKNSTLQQLKHPAGRSELPARGTQVASQRTPVLPKDTRQQKRQNEHLLSSKKEY